MFDEDRKPKDRPYRANVKFFALVIGIAAAIIVAVYVIVGPI